MLYLRTFGGLSLEGPPAIRTGAGGQRKPLALLALLATSEPPGLSRDQVLAFLWPERDEEHARPALRQTLHALRRDLAAPDLFTDGADLRLNPEVIGSDVAELTRASAEGDPATVARLYRGPFLDGFHLSDAPEFERWIDRQRTRFATLARDALEALAQRSGREGDHLAAAQWWRQAAGIEPTNGRVALGLMRALAAAGDRAAALQHARVYETLIREELGADPEPDVLDFAEQLRRQPASAPPAPPPALAPVPASAPDPPTAARTASAEPSPSVSARRRGFALAAVLALSLAAALLLVRPRVQDRSRAELDPAVLAVAPFQVFEPDLEEWREGMVDVLSRDLDGAGELRTIAPSVVLRAAGGGLDGISAAGLGRATGAGTVLAGSLLRAGPDSVRATITLIDARTGQVLDEVIRADQTDRMDRLADSLTLAVVRGLASRGIAEAKLRPGIRSTSLEAVKLFLRGERHFRETRWDSARFYYERAITVDSGLALAHRRMGHVLTWQRVNFDSVATQYLLRAGELNHGLGPRDSLLVRCDSLSAAANETSEALVYWRLARQLFATAGEATAQYPEDPEVWYTLGDAGYHFGFGAGLTVREPQILEAFDRAIAADSGFAPAYLHAIELAVNTGGSAAALRYIEKYLALNPVDGSEAGVRLAARLLGSPPPAPEELDRLLDTVPADVLSSTRTMLRSWADPAETAVLLSRLLAQGRPSAYPLFSDTVRMRRRLAEQLAFRGHVREAHQVLGPSETGIFAELALLGAVPPESARVAFGEWQHAGSSLTRRAFPWWAAQGDSASLRRAVANARTALRDRDEAIRFEASYDSAAALAYLALLRGDTVEALSHFTGLPDSACVSCYVDRLTRARLLAARGRHGEALESLYERIIAYSTPFQVVFAAERARVAEALGLEEVAQADRTFVRRAWLHADPELRDDWVAGQSGAPR